ncbi:MAG: DRTGG domain-containing protein [Chloroflexota bacterium]
MATLLITSAETGAGKTMVAAGLARRLVSDNQRVGFIRPLTGDDGGASAGSDAAFMKGLLSLTEGPALLSPALGQLNKTLARVAGDKGVVIIEGPGIAAAPAVAEALNARVIVVASYNGPAASYDGFGERLLGFVLNKVPRRRLEKVTAQAAEKRLGVIPEDRALYTLTVAELAACLQGKFLNAEEKAGELVENIMLGAMIVGHGPDYFGRLANKAAIIRSGRHDMQLAALETSLCCLVLCGPDSPIPAVLHRAGEQQVPIITTGQDTATAVGNIEAALAGNRFHQPQKLDRLGNIMAKNINFPALYQGLGIAA